MDDIEKFEQDISTLETLIRDYWCSKKKKDGEYWLIEEDIKKELRRQSEKNRRY